MWILSSKYAKPKISWNVFIYDLSCLVYKKTRHSISDKTIDNIICYCSKTIRQFQEAVSCTGDSTVFNWVISFGMTGQNAMQRRVMEKFANKSTKTHGKVMEISFNNLAETLFEQHVMLPDALQKMDPPVVLPKQVSCLKTMIAMAHYAPKQADKG